MFKLVKRVTGRLSKRDAPAGPRAGGGSVSDPGEAKARPARARKGAAPAKPGKGPGRGSPAKPRAGLAEILRWIEAGGMPARAPKARARVSTPRGASFRRAIYANDQDQRAYRLYLPAKPPAAPPPLIVMLHGCGQTPEDFAAGTRMNALAEELGFLVVYPAQASKANSGGCWNWFLRGDQARGAGEPALIAGIVRTVLREHAADPARVYIAGLSAGGSAAHVIAGAYPDIFAAVGVHSGIPAGGAHNAASAFLAMRHGAPGDRPGTAVPTIVFHGAADTVVHPRNGRFVEARTLAAHPPPAHASRRAAEHRTGAPGGRRSIAARMAGPGASTGSSKSRGMPGPAVIPRAATRIPPARTPPARWRASSSGTASQPGGAVRIFPDRAAR